MDPTASVKVAMEHLLKNLDSFMKHYMLHLLKGDVDYEMLSLYTDY